jgi:N utilization substance protein A
VSDKLIAKFINATGMDATMARCLVDEGYTTVEELAFVPVAEMKTICGLDFDAYLVYRQRARDFIYRDAP